MTAEAVPRRRRPWRVAGVVVAVLLLAAGAGWVLLGSPLFGVRDVRITGAGLIPRSRVLAAAAITPGIPLLRLDTAGVARRVGALPQVLTARVTESWPGTVIIAITPRVAVLAVPAQSGYDVIDSGGVVLAWTPQPPSGLPVLTAPAGPASALRGSAEVRAAGTVVRGLPGWLRRRVVAVQAAGPDGVTLILRGGLTVVWGSARGSAAKAGEVAVLLRTGARYYDVSDPAAAVTSGGRGAG